MEVIDLIKKKEKSQYCAIKVVVFMFKVEEEITHSFKSANQQSFHVSNDTSDHDEKKIIQLITANDARIKVTDWNFTNKILINCIIKHIIKGFPLPTPGASTMALT